MKSPTKQLNQAAEEITLAQFTCIGNHLIHKSNRQLACDLANAITTNSTLVGMAKKLDEANHAIETGRQAFDRIREITGVLHGEVGLPAESLVQRLAQERDQLTKRVAELEAKVPKESSHFETSSAQES